MLRRASAIQVDDSALLRTLEDVSKRELPYVMELTINSLMRDTARIEQFEMQHALDRPTPFVLRSLKLGKLARKKQLPVSGAIAFLDLGGGGQSGLGAAEEAIEPQIEGGIRRPKASERRLRKIGMLAQNEWLVGFKTAQNRYGNIPPKFSIEMLAYFRGFWEGGYNANRAVGARALRRGVRFYVQDLGRSRGIFRVQGKRGKPKLIWLIVKNTPSYRKRFDFYGLADRHALKWGPYFGEKAKQRAMKTAR